ncbi:unnamed protein product, partial [Meganyctiphanes norvegica]
IKKCERWGVIAMVRKLYEKYNKADFLKITDLYKESYKEESQRIFDLQNTSLSSDKIITTDEESEPEETESTNDSKRLQLQQVNMEENVDSNFEIKAESNLKNDAIKLSVLSEEVQTVSNTREICQIETKGCSNQVLKNTSDATLNKDELSNELTDKDYDHLNLKLLKVPLKRLIESDITQNFCQIYNIGNVSSQRVKRQLSCDGLSVKRFASETSLSSFSELSNEGLQVSPLRDEIHPKENMQLSSGANETQFPLSSVDPYDFEANEELMPDVSLRKENSLKVKNETDNSHLLQHQLGESNQLSFQQMVERMEENDNIEIKETHEECDNSKETDKTILGDFCCAGKITESIPNKNIKQELESKEKQQGLINQEDDILTITEQKQDENIYSKVNFIIGPKTACNSKVNYMQGDVLRIVRTFQTPDGKKYSRTEIVRNPDVIKAYVNIRTTKDEEFVSTYISKLDETQKKKLHKERRRIQEQLRRIKRHEDKVRKGIVDYREKKSLKKRDISSTCGACGQVGHMRTNRNCPLNSKKEVVEVEIEDSQETNSSSDEEEEETIVDISDDTQELVKVEGTKITLSASVVKSAEKYKESSPVVTKPLIKRSTSQKDKQTFVKEKEQQTTVKEKPGFSREKGKQS